MKYIIMAAGMGTRLQPLTLSHPKPLYKLDGSTTVLERMVRKIAEHDSDADIVIVTGHMRDSMYGLDFGSARVSFAHNPFYRVTNSIASLWLAKEHLTQGDVVLVYGDIVMCNKAIDQKVCSEVTRPEVLLDSSRRMGDYNVEVSGGRVLVMSKELVIYHGEYAGVTRLDGESAMLLRDEVCSMVNDGFYDQWYENALVQMVFKYGFDLYYSDIASYEWTEIDSVNDLLAAKRIHAKEMPA